MHFWCKVVVLLVLLELVHSSESTSLDNEEDALLERAVSPTDGESMAASLKKWQTDQESAATDRALEIMSQVEQHARSRVDNNKVTIGRSEANLEQLKRTVVHRDHEVSEDLEDAKAQSEASALAIEAANRAIVAEKSRRIPLDDQQKQNLKLGSRMFTDAQEMGSTGTKERAATIVKLQTEVAARIHEYETSHREQLADPFRERNKKLGLHKLNQQFRHAAAHEAKEHRERLSQLQKQLDDMQPQLKALANDEHESKVLDMQYMVLKQKLTQLAMINKYDRNPSVEKAQAQIHSAAEKGSEEIQSNLSELSTKLKRTAEDVQEEVSEATESQSVAADDHRAQEIIQASTPKQLEVSLGEGITPTH